MLSWESCWNLEKLRLLGRERAENSEVFLFYFFFLFLQLGIRVWLLIVMHRPFPVTFEELKRFLRHGHYLGLLPRLLKPFPEACSLCLLKQLILISEPYPKKSGSINEVSDPEDELTDSQKTSKLSEIYSTTIPSVDSAMESWDGSGIDAGYGSQGKTGCLFSRVSGPRRRQTDHPSLSRDWTWAKDRGLTALAQLLAFSKEQNVF